MHGPWDPDWSCVMTGYRGRRGWPGSDAVAGMWSEWWRSPPPRAERGVVRWLVLDAIATQPRHGYEIIQAIGEKSGGFWLFFGKKWGDEGFVVIAVQGIENHVGFQGV